MTDKHTEYYMEDAHNIYRALYEGSRDGYARVDMQGKIVECNTRFQQMLGYGKEELYTLTYEDITPKKWHEHEQHIITRQVMERGYSDLYEKEYVRKDGTVFPIEIQTYLVHDHAGNPNGMWASVRDVSVTQSARNALHESEYKYRTLFDGASDAIFIVKDYLFIDCNKKTLEMFRCKRDQIIGKPPYAFSPPFQDDGRRSKEKALEKMNAALQGIPQIFEWIHCTLDGTPFYAEVSLSTIMLNSVPHIQAFVRDIDERKKSERALRIFEERLRQIIENAQVWIWEVDAEGLYTYSSPTVEKILGYRPEDLVEKKYYYDLFAPEQREMMKKRASSFFKKQKSFHEFINCNIHKQGHEVWLITSGVPYYDKDGRFMGYRGVDTDITEQKHAQNILKQDKEEVEKVVKERTKELMKTQEALNEAKRLSEIGMLAATVAHELRNPLAAVRIATYNIKKKNSNQQLEKHIGNIEKKVAEGDQIIDNLLFYTRLKKVHHKRIHLYDIVMESISTAEKRYEDLGIVLHCRIEGIQEVLISADPLHMRELFNNVLNNAYESFHEKRGTIDVYAKTEKDFVHVEISDTGIGITKKDLKKVFEPFYTTKAKGTGLGFTVAQQIVTLHNGHIFLKSHQNKGTTVTIFLPLDRVSRELFSPYA